MKNITVIGAGTMGNGIAHTFAQKDFNVNLVDISSETLEKAIITIEKNLERMVVKEKITKADKSNTLSNITTYTDITKGVKGADLVVEAATENADLKLLKHGMSRKKRGFLKGGKQMSRSETETFVRLYTIDSHRGYNDHIIECSALHSVVKKLFKDRGYGVVSPQQAFDFAMILQHMDRN